MPDKPTCESCRFFYPGVDVCRRYPPVPIVVRPQVMVDHEWQAEEIATYWPDVESDWWCGEYQPKPES